MSRLQLRLFVGVLGAVAIGATAVLLVTSSVFESRSVGQENAGSLRSSAEGGLGRDDSSGAARDEVTAEALVDILVVGDLFLDRHIRQALAEHGNDYPLAPLADFLAGHDIVLANHEGPMTDQASVSIHARVGEPNNTRFTFSPDTRAMLQRYGFTSLSLANNHGLDFGAAGLAQTRTLLGESGFTVFGHPQNRSGLSATHTVRGHQIGLVGYQGIWGEDATGVIAEIERLRPEVELLLVYPHWGTEYQRTPSARQRELGHAFIDAGADVVIGSHPHVIQPVELYAGRPIFYSLGNFLFDQTFSRETRESLAVQLRWLPGEPLAVTLTPLLTTNLQTAVAAGDDRAAMLQFVSDKSDVPAADRAALANGEWIIPVPSGAN